MTHIPLALKALMTPQEAARYIGLAVATLAKMRSWGGGPPFLKLGGAVRYEPERLDEWLNLRRARNTSDASRLPSKLTDEFREILRAPSHKGGAQ